MFNHKMGGKSTKTLLSKIVHFMVSTGKRPSLMTFLDFISLGWFLFVCLIPPGLTSFLMLVSLGQNTNSKEFTFLIVTSLLEVASLIAGSAALALCTSLMKFLPVSGCSTSHPAHRAILFWCSFYAFWLY